MRDGLKAVFDPGSPGGGGEILGMMGRLMRLWLEGVSWSEGRGGSIEIPVRRDR